MMGLLLRNPWVILGITAALAASHLALYAQGRSDGRNAAEVVHQRAVAEDSARDQADRDAVQRALDDRAARLADKERTIAEAIKNANQQFDTIKTVVRREIVDRPVYRDCRIDERMRQHLNAALAGGGMPGAAGVPAGGSELSGGAAVAP